MGAIVKNINFHAEDINPLLQYTSDKSKTSLIENGLSNLLSYAANPDKTTITLPQEGEKSELVTGVLCDPYFANSDFAMLRNKYRETHKEYIPSFDYLDVKTGTIKDVSKNPVTAIHIIQSFEETDIDPRVANQIGVELCERLGVMAVVDTHMNKEHIHNHIVVNAYMPDGNSKYFVNSETRMDLRRLSDEIQLEYGLEVKFLDPKLQLEASHSKSMKHNEWESRKNGTSWKQDMREDIIAAKSVSDTKEEFIDVMKDYGYEVEKETAKGIMWKDKQTGKKIMDTTLGPEYTTANLFKESQLGDIEVKAKQDEEIKATSTFTKPLSISRYDISGRRRSNLEIMFRKVIAIIQRISNFINKVERDANRTYNGVAKLDTMQAAIKIIQEYGIEDINDLNEKINVAGKNLNTVKQNVSKLNTELAYYDTVLRIIKEYENAQTLYNSVQKWAVAHNFYVDTFSETEISISNASLSPMTMKQRSELYKMLEEHPEYRIRKALKGYSNVSAMQFTEIEAYFKGKGPKPDYLISKTENTAENAYERNYERLSSSAIGTPSQDQKDYAEKLLLEHGFTIDKDKLTVADVINIKNCYEDNPFGSPLVSADKLKALNDLLAQKGKTLNRDIITETEYQEVIDYLNYKKKGLPNVLKSDIAEPSETDLDKVRKLSNIMLLSPTVPYEKMNSIDVRNYYNWLVSQGQDPMCTRLDNPIHRKENQERFHEEVEVETIKKQEILIALRNSLNTLAQLGIDVSDINTIKEMITKIKAEHEEAVKTQETYTREYKELLKLKQYTSYAKNKNYIYGSLFDQKQINKIEEVIKEEQYKENEVPENRKKEEKEQKDTTKKKHPILDDHTL